MAADPQTEFIAHDWCGWSQHLGRFTHCPSGNTLVCQPSDTQESWDRKQLAFLAEYPGLTVYECPDAYSPDNPVMATVDEAVARLRNRVREEARCA